MEDDLSFIIEIQDEFLDESNGFLEQTESHFLELEKNPNNLPILEDILRMAHNIKGSAAAVGFEDFSHFSHQFENLLVKVKSGEVVTTSGVVDVLLASNDMLKTFITSLQKDKSAKVDTTAILSRIDSILNNSATDENIEQMNSMAAQTAEVKINVPKVKPASSLGDIKSGDDQALKKPDEFIRLPIKKIEDLLNDFSEQVILQSSLEHFKDDISGNADSIGRTILQLGKITHELQQTAIALRMLSLKNLFNKMQRTVRDTSKHLDKVVKFIAVGEDTELDKTMIDELSSPLTHIVRNSVDHGIESKEIRAERGKPEHGTITMTASYSGRYFYLIIEDDGGGLNHQKIKEKAIKKGLIQEGQEVSEKEIINFVFASGFSTHDVATDISGRGVGMDAIKKSIEKLRGTIEIDSKYELGTKITIKLPPTLAIFNGMVVRSEKKKYIVPSSEVLEIYHANIDEGRYVSSGERIIKIKDSVYPIVDLRELFGLPKKEKKIHDSNDVLFLMQRYEKRYLIHVDEILIQQRIVFKNLGREIEGLPGIAGGTILADGSVALILELGDIVDIYKEGL